MSAAETAEAAINAMEKMARKMILFFLVGETRDVASCGSLILNEVPDPSPGSDSVGPSLP
jgi:hypothetical protein